MSMAEMFEDYKMHRDWDRETYDSCMEKDADLTRKVICYTKNRLMLKSIKDPIFKMYADLSLAGCIFDENFARDTGLSPDEVEYMRRKLRNIRKIFDV